MTTAAGFSFCHAAQEGVDDIEPRWRVLCEDAVSAHRVMQSLCEKISVIGSSVTQFKSSIETLPRLSSNLESTAEAVDSITEKILQVEKLATMLEAEKTRSQHLQRMVATQKQVKKHIADNKKEAQIAEDRLKEEFFEKKKDDRLKAMKQQQQLKASFNTSEGSAKEKVRRSSIITASDGQPEAPPPLPQSEETTTAPPPAPLQPNAPVLEKPSEESPVEETPVKEEPTGITCTFCSYLIPQDEDVCAMCDEPASPLKTEEGENAEEEGNEEDGSTREDAEPHASTASNDNSPTVISATITTTTEGVDVTYPSPGASLPPTEDDTSD